MNNFETALQLILINEGGYSNHKNDKGGATNKGITQGVYNSYLKKLKISFKDIKYITNEEVKDIYYNKYWIPSKSNFMNTLLSIVHFDTAVNWGVTGANKILQHILNVTVDGIIGNNTLNEIKLFDDYELSIKYCDYRIERRYKIVNNNPSQKVFLNGWINRDNRVKNFVNKLKK